MNLFGCFLIALVALWCLNPVNAARSGSARLNTVMQVSDVLTRREARLKKIYALQADPKLQAEISVVEVDPDLKDLLRRLEEATRLSLSVAPELSEHQPKFGNLKLSNEPAYRIMRRLAQTQLEEGWWEKTEEGYRLVAKSSSSAKDLAGKKAHDKAMDNAAKALAFHPLGLDPKLHARLTVFEKSPKVASLLVRLAEVTGLKFTLADNLLHHDPELGDFQLKNTRAYSFMEIIAERDLDNGHWKKTADGYRLEGGSQTPLPPRKFTWLWPALGLGVTFIAVGGFVIFWWRGKKAAAKPTPL